MAGTAQRSVTTGANERDFCHMHAASSTLPARAKHGRSSFFQATAAVLYLSCVGLVAFAGEAAVFIAHHVFIDVNYHVVHDAVTIFVSKTASVFGADRRLHCNVIYTIQNEGIGTTAFLGLK